MTRKRKHRVARRGEVTVADMVFMDLGIDFRRRRRPRRRRKRRTSDASESRIEQILRANEGAWGRFYDPPDDGDENRRRGSHSKPKRRRPKRRGRWIQKALKVRRRRVRHHLRVQGAHKGLLHRQLGIPSGKKITAAQLRKAHQEARLELRHAENAREKKAARSFLARVQFAINARKFRR